MSEPTIAEVQEARQVDSTQRVGVDSPRFVQFVAYRVIVGGSMALMVGLSWPLWAGGSSLPRVPFLSAVPEPPGEWLVPSLLLALILLAVVASAFQPQLSSRLGRYLPSALDLVATLILAWLVLADQHRLQPWVYQYLLLGLAFVATSQDRALGLARLFVIALYIHSGLSKLDLTFSRELGLLFLRTGLRPLGLDPLGWSLPVRTVAVLAMPAAELVVGLGLIFPSTRRFAVGGAVLVHGVLLGILGPWGLAHSTIVLIWNAAMMLGVVVLFGPERSLEYQPQPRGLAMACERVVLYIFLMAAGLPFLERWGLWDTWPSFALYASHGERLEVEIWKPTIDLDRLPTDVEPYLRLDPSTDQYIVDLNGWSLAERGTPVYPQVRAMLGLAEAMADLPGRPTRLSVRILGRADRIDGSRREESLWGVGAIRSRDLDYQWNTHPAGSKLLDPNWNE